MDSLSNNVNNNEKKFFGSKQNYATV